MARKHSCSTLMHICSKTFYLKVFMIMSLCFRELSKSPLQLTRHLLHFHLTPSYTSICILTSKQVNQSCLTQLFRNLFPRPYIVGSSRHFVQSQVMTHSYLHQSSHLNLQNQAALKPVEPPSYPCTAYSVS